MLLIIIRTFKEGVNNFVRNGWLSVAAVSVLLFSLYIISFLFVITTTANFLIKDIQNKVNISVYFKTSVPEEEILAVKDELARKDKIKSVEYISREKALEDFKRNNEKEPVIMQSLAEIGDNPLLASIMIKAHNVNEYESIVASLGETDFQDKISRINYGKNKEIIEKLNRIISEIKKIGTGVVILFAVISILIVFNTIRITIYTHRQEIEVMRLVGASNMFIRLPYMWEGIIYGFIATVLSTIFLFGTLWFVAPKVSSVIPGNYIIISFREYFLIIVGLQIVVGVVLGILSGGIAIRKYLKV